jgi:hypothetical protein
LFKGGGLRWSPDSDAVNASDDALLRADNLVPDQTGALALRNGSTRLYTALNAAGAGDVNALHTVELSNGTTYRVAGIDDRIFINGVDQSVTLDGSGDLAIGDDSYQVFMARGTKKKKYDGSVFRNWGITRPVGTPTLAAVAAITKSAAAFDSSESPATAADEGTSTATTDEGGTSNAARLVTPSASTSRAVVTRLFTTDQDFLDISGSEGSETDLFDLYVKFEDPQRVEDVTIIFGADNSSTLPFTTDRFEFKFDFRNTISVNIKDIKSEGFGSYDASVQAQLASINPTSVTGVRTPASVKSGIRAVGSTPSPVSGARPDPNKWGHLSVTRGQFKRIGSTAARGWNTIRGFQVVYKVQNGYTKTATFADAIMIGGGDRSLTGTFRAVVVAARTTSTYIELSPPSTESTEINLNHQTLQVTIPAAMINNADAGVDQFWIYLFGGFLDGYYRCHVSGAVPSSGQTLDELTTPDGSNMGDADERSRITSHGMTMQSGVASSDIAITLSKSELDILTENERLEPYTSGPVDNIMAIAGPWNNRLFTLTTEGYVYPSSNKSPTSFNTLQVLDLTKYGNPLWMKKSAAGIVVGMEKDVVFLAGSGDESADMTTIDLYPQPLNVGNPPVDKMASVDGNMVIYRSADGLMQLAGTSIQAMPLQGTSLLWRGQTRHGVSGLNITTGRFRSAIDNLMYYVLAPETTSTSSQTILRYSFSDQQWSRLTYAQAGNFLSILKEPNGTLIAGDDAGGIWNLDTGTQDQNVDIAARLLTPIADGGNPLAYKDAFDLQLHCNTAGKTGTVNLYKDGSATAGFTGTFSTTINGVYRLQASDLARFLRAQLEITGNFTSFSLQRYSLSYRARPQHSSYLDSGYILPNQPGDIVWLQEVEFDAICSNDFTLELYHDDVLKYSVGVTATTGVRTTYVIPLPRGSQAKRPRLVFKTQGSNAEGHVGFDCYGIRVRVANAGNDNGSPYLPVYPVGQAS